MTKVSIDLWGTLIKSSPQFVSAKYELVSRYFPKATEAEIRNGFASAKDKLNAIIELTGWQPSKSFIYDVLLKSIDPSFNDLYTYFYFDYRGLALKHTPDIYSDETIEYLEKMKEEGFDLILSSNTMLIEGSYMLAIITKLHLHKYFDVINFSDIEGYSKPNPAMYSDSQFHIGDNPVTDGLGAKRAGSTPIIINSTPLTIKDAYDFIIRNI